MNATTQVEIGADQATAWQAVSDVASWPAWTTSMTELDEGRGFTWSTRSPGVVATGGHWLEPGAAGTRLTLDVAQRGPLAGLVGALTGRRTRRYLQLEAAGLKAAAEART